MERLKLGSVSIEIIRKDIKNMHLSVNPPDGFVRMSVPEKMGVDAIRAYAISKLGWVRIRQRKFKSQERMPAREFLTQETHYYLGQRYLLNVIERNTPPSVRVRNKKFIDLYVRPSSTTARRRIVMQEWYRTSLQEIIPKQIAKWEKVIGVKANDWRIRSMKTKWGSCSRDSKRIWLNLELAKKPVECIEYIVVHELVHLKERNHTSRFYDLMDKVMPNWRFLRDELNRLPLEDIGTVISDETD